MGKPRKCTETEAATKVSGRGNMATSMDNEGNPQGATDSASDLASIRIDHEAQSQLCEIKDLLKKQAEAELGTKEMLKKHIESSSAASKLLESKFDNLSQQIIHATAGVTSLNTRVQEMETKNVALGLEVREVREQLQILQDERRERNIVIEGLPDSATENVRTAVSSLLEDLTVSFTANDVDSVYRMGRYVEGMQRPRPVMLKLATMTQKKEIFRMIHLLKGKAKWSKVHLQDDLPKETLNQRRDIRCIASLARTMDIECQVRGSVLHIGGRRYTYDDLNTLPHGLSLEKAKIVEVQDGFAFQSHHAFLSNLYPARITYKGATYPTVEHLYHAVCAEFHEQHDLARNIRTTKDPYLAKRLAQKIQTKREWNNCKVAQMEKFVNLKFEQNNELKDKLLVTKGHLYEATLDQVFGCGYTLAQRQQIRQGNIKGQNQLGCMLESIRDKLKVNTDQQ